MRHWRLGIALAALFIFTPLSFGGETTDIAACELGAHPPSQTFLGWLKKQWRKYQAINELAEMESRIGGMQALEENALLGISIARGIEQSDHISIATYSNAVRMRSDAISAAQAKYGVEGVYHAERQLSLSYRMQPPRDPNSAFAIAVGLGIRYRFAELLLTSRMAAWDALKVDIWKAKTEYLEEALRVARQKLQIAQQSQILSRNTDYGTPEEIQARIAQLESDLAEARIGHQREQRIRDQNKESVQKKAAAWLNRLTRLGPVLRNALRQSVDAYWAGLPAAGKPGEISPYEDPLVTLAEAKLMALEQKP